MRCCGYKGVDIVFEMTTLTSQDQTKTENWFFKSSADGIFVEKPVSQEKHRQGFSRITSWKHLMCLPSGHE